jgi:hypothetical protein
MGHSVFIEINEAGLNRQEIGLTTRNLPSLGLDSAWLLGYRVPSSQLQNKDIEVMLRGRVRDYALTLNWIEREGNPS